MLLTALVLDTNSFQYTGKIKVRIQKYCVLPVEWDMAHPTNTDGEVILDGYDASSGYSGDFDAYVMSPFGVGKNSSLYFLPRVNSKGLVSPLGGHDSKLFVWVGGIFDKDATGEISTPSQSFEGEQKAEVNKNAFVFRTKTTSMSPDYSNINRSLFNWDLKLTENLIIIDENKIHIRHFSEYDDKGVPVVYSDVYIGSAFISSGGTPDKGKYEEIIKIEVVDKKEAGKEKTNVINISQSGTKLKYTNNEEKAENTLTIDSASLSMVSTINKKTSTYKQTGENISIFAENTVIKLEKENIHLSADKAVLIAAKEVRIGGSNAGVLVTESAGDSFRFVDGEIARKSKFIFG